MSKGKGMSAFLLTPVKEAGAASAAVQLEGEQGSCKLIFPSFLGSRCVLRTRATVGLWNLTIATHPFAVAFYIMLGGVYIYQGIFLSMSSGTRGAGHLIADGVDSGHGALQKSLCIVTVHCKSLSNGGRNR